MNALRNKNTPSENTSEATKMKVETLFVRSIWIVFRLRIWEPRKKKIAKTVAS